MCLVPQTSPHMSFPLLSAVSFPVTITAERTNKCWVLGVLLEMHGTWGRGVVLVTLTQIAAGFLERGSSLDQGHELELKGFQQLPPDSWTSTLTSWESHIAPSNDSVSTSFSVLNRFLSE